MLGPELDLGDCETSMLRISLNMAIAIFVKFVIKFAGNTNFNIILSLHL